jgi:arginine/lysine/ornithine decarboxylase
MPGHKGKTIVGCESLDITEIDGADSLWEADGIIAESEQNAGKLFGANTFYSTEGSSLCIRAMLYLALLDAKTCGRAPTILAGRNAHKAFVSAACLLDLDVKWIEAQEQSYLRCTPTPERVASLLDACERMPAAVYLTSPDYLGNTCDVAGIANVCRDRGTLLLVDNAHGAYLKFLPKSEHPIELGAHMCADSAHKTLPALTGAAYLHIDRDCQSHLAQGAKLALSTFGSTSPSYLILQSLDAVNAYIADGYAERLARFIPMVDECKERLRALGFGIVGDESLKITLATKAYGYEGGELAATMAEKGFVCEFADKDYLVMMLSCDMTASELDSLCDAFASVPRREPIMSAPPAAHIPTRKMSVRDAAMSPFESVPLSEAIGRILASPTVSCPPAVPIVVCGEQIDQAAVAALEYYGAKECLVVK